MAIKYFIAAANKGNPDAQTNLSGILKNKLKIK